MIIENLKTQLLSTLMPDARLADSWAKFVVEIDYDSKSGYMYVGGFIGDQAIELDDRPHVVLVHGAWRDNSEPLMYEDARPFIWLRYAAAILHPDGRLERTQIMREFEPDRKAGRWGRKDKKWALVMRDEIAELVAHVAGLEPNPLAAYDDMELLAEMARRGYTLTQLDLDVDPDAPALASVRELRRYLQQLAALP